MSLALWYDKYLPTSLRSPARRGLCHSPFFLGHRLMFTMCSNRHLEEIIGILQMELREVPADSPVYTDVQTELAAALKEQRLRIFFGEMPASNTH